MSNSHELSTTTVHIQLSDEFLNSIRSGKKLKDTDPNINISDTENPVYRELLNNVYDAVIICNVTGNILDFNQRALDFFLYSADTLHTINIKKIIMGLTDETLGNLKANADNKLLSLMEGTCLRNDQTNFPSEITVNKINLNYKEFLIFSIRNIHRRKEAELDLKNAYQKLNVSNLQLQDREKELASERDLLHTLLAEVPEYISFKDKDLKYIRINNALASLFGLDSPEEAIGKSQGDFIPEEPAIASNEEDRIVLETGKPLINNESLLPINDQSIWLTSSQVPIRDKEGNINGIVTISRDTTEKKKANELLIQAKTKAEEANKLKNDFIANITHELRTPLNPIIGFTTIIKNSYDDYSKDRGLLEEHTNYILEAALHLQGIIEDLLTIANSEQKTEFKLTTFSADSLIAEIVNIHHYQIQKNNITLNIFTPNDISILFHCDRSKLFHIISNYLGNAVKFTPKGGCISIKVSLESDQLTFEIEDNGIGIAEKDQTRIFDRFTQADNILTKSYEGTGLGLAIVKELCEVIGCTPYLESELDKGSKFGIKIPPTLFEALS